MAIRGQDNIASVVRESGAPYWKIFENLEAQKNGSFIQRSSIEPDLNMTDSCQALYNALDRLTPGDYLLRSFKQPASNQPIVSTKIVIGYNEASKQDATISGIGSISAADVDAMVSAKLKEHLEQQRREDELRRLKEEIATLKQEKKDGENGLMKGIASIGTVLFPLAKKSPFFREAIGVITELKKNVGTGATEDALPVPMEPAELGSANNDDQASIEESLEELAKDNPNIVKELKLLAQLKKKNPDMYREGVGFAESLIDD